ncbi:MAG: COX15/CtaA family protein [Burkholderiales bacterium]|nr:COX15/CtaA family protein [Burkholderiales bacterium]
MALLCAVLVLAITSLSAFLRLSKAGLGCAPWPQCYGQALREQQAGAQAGAAGAATMGLGMAQNETVSHEVALARLAHRVVATVALVLVIVLVLSTLGERPRRTDELVTALALLAVALFLAVLGLRTAASRLPVVALGNLLGGFAMLALAARLAVPAVPPRGALRPWAALALGGVLVQVLLGGLVSASFASLSCSGLGGCLAAAAQQGWPWAALDPWREPVFAAATAGPVNPAGALALGLHRVAGIVLLLLLLPTALLAWRQGRVRGAALLLGLVVVQMGLGLWLSAGTLPLAAALAHNLGAALMLTLLLRWVR